MTTMVEVLRRRAKALRNKAERLRKQDEYSGKYPENWAVAERLCKRANKLEDAAEVLVREASFDAHVDGEEDTE